MGAKKYYVIWAGHQTGIVETWEECKRLTQGYKGARYKSFKTKEEAEKAYENPWSKEMENSAGKKPRTKKFA
ncbi:MAG: viroplasmin family protein, partial [Bacteroidota bacterium]